MKIYYVALLLAPCILLISSCAEPAPKKYELPVEICTTFNEHCPFEAIREWDQVPEKIRAESRKVLLDYMALEDIERDIEFVEYRIKTDCEELDRRGYIFNPFEINFIRHFDNGVVSKHCFRMVFTLDQSFRSCNLANLERNPDYKNYIKRSDFDSIVLANNFQDYTYVGLGSYYLPDELHITKKKDPSKQEIIFNKARATVNLHTGEFNSREEWNKSTASNINLLPKFGEIEKMPDQLAQDSSLIDSLLQNGQTRRAASTALIRKASKYLGKKPKKAMHLFNQAYLLDSTNAEVYWGFGLLASKSSDYTANDWFDIGLALDSKNIRLLRSYGNFEKRMFSYLVENQKEQLNELEREEKKAKESGQAINAHRLRYLTNGIAEQKVKRQEQFDLALSYYTKVLALVPGDLETMSILARFYLDVVDCVNAKDYYAKTKVLRDNCSAKCFESQLVKKCGSVM